MKDEGKKIKNTPDDANGEEILCHVYDQAIIEASDEAEGHEAVFCEGECQGWIHRHCAGLTRPAFNSLSASIPYLCSYCTCTRQYKEICSLKDTIEDLTNRLAKFEKPQNPTQSTEVPTRPPQLPVSADEHITTMIDDYISEEKEKAKRRLNIIIHNIPESASDDGNTRKKHDIDFVTDICQQHLNTNITINKCFRLGKKGAKPRLLKVALGTDLEKTKVLRNCTKLRDQKLPPVLYNVFTPDLTTKERETNKNLRAQLKDMNKGGRQFQIKNGKIVERKK